MIGKLANPDCFKNKMSVNYNANFKAEKISAIFRTNLRQWKSNLKLKKRKIVLQVGFKAIEHKYEAPTYESRSNIFAAKALGKITFENVKTVDKNETFSINLGCINFIQKCLANCYPKKHAHAFNHG